MDDDRFVLAKLEHAVTLLALLIVIEEMEFNDVERFAISEVLRDVADKVEHRVQ